MAVRKRHFNTAWVANVVAMGSSKGVKLMGKTVFSPSRSLSEAYCYFCALLLLLATDATTVLRCPHGQIEPVNRACPYRTEHNHCARRAVRM